MTTLTQDQKISIGNRYTIEKTIGSGSMGEVHLVSDSLFQNRLIALKQIKSECLTTDSLNAFQQEFVAMTRLKHPNVLEVYDFDYDEERSSHYITMEYFQGIPLKDILYDYSTLEYEQKVAILISLCRAIDFIHSRNILHRDLAPQNILIKDTIVKVMDFGLADLQQEEETGTIRGTLTHLAPEVLAGKAESKSDIFSLGVIAFELFSGYNLYHGMNSSQNIIHCLRSEEAFNGTVKNRLASVKDQKLHEILEKMVAFIPNDRFCSGADIILALNTYLSKQYDVESKETKKSWILGAGFVGRHKEISALKDLVTGENVTNTSRDFVLQINGEPGVGKSRLMSEFRTFCQLNTILFSEGSCYRDISNLFSPWLSIVNELLLKSPKEIVRKYGPELKKIVPMHPNLKFITVNASYEPRTERIIQVKTVVDFIMETLKDFVKPSVLYLNDVQWIDEASMQVMEKILRLMKREKSRYSVFLVMSCRIEGLNHIKNLQKITSINQIMLNPFDIDDVKAYMHTVFGYDNIGEALNSSVEYINERVSGNPFFLQEYIHALVEKNMLVRHKKNWDLTTDIASIAIPQSIDEIIVAKLKNSILEEDQKMLLDIMALLNRHVLFEELKVLTKATDEMVTRLVTLEILKFENHNDEIHYKIYHDLIRDTILAHISDAKNLHAHIALNLEELYTDPNKSHIEEIGEHFYKANIKEKAIFYLNKAIENAQTSMENNKVLRYADILLELLPDTQGIEKVNILKIKGLTFVLTGKGTQGLATLKKALITAEKVNDPTVIIELLHFYSIHSVFNKGIIDPEEILQTLEKFLAFAEKVSDKAGLAKCYNNYGLFYYLLKKDLETAFHYHEEGLKIAEEAKDHLALAFNMGNISRLYFLKGDITKALEYNTKAKNLIEKHDTRNKVDLITGNQFNAFYLLLLKEYDEAVKYYDIVEKQSLDLFDISNFMKACEYRLFIYIEQKKFDKIIEIEKKIRIHIDEIDNEKRKKHLNIIITLRKAQYDAYTQGKKEGSSKTIQALLEDVELIEYQRLCAYELWRMTKNEEDRKQALKFYKNEQDLIGEYPFKDHLEELRTGIVANDIYGEQTIDLSELVYDDLPLPAQNFIQEYETKQTEIIDSVKNELSKQITPLLSKEFFPLMKSVIDFHRHAGAPNRLSETISQDRDLSQLLTIIQDLNSDLSLESLLEKILNACINFLHAERGAIILKGDDGAYTIQEARTRMNEKISTFIPSQTVIDKVKEENTPVFIPDLIENEDEFNSQSILDLKLQSVMCAPLLKKIKDIQSSHHEDDPNENILLGFLYLDSKDITKKDSFSGNNLQLLKALADQASIAIYNANINKTLKETIEQKTQAEHEVRQLNDHLEDKVKQRTAELEAAHKKLQEQAYKEGMADIATTVLHNIGNILNSVVTSNQLIDKTLKNSMISGLTKANRLIQEHIDDLGTFLSSNPKGKKLLEYYGMVENVLKEEQKIVLHHTNRLEGKTKVIQEVIKTQQNYTTVKKFNEPVNLEEIIEDSITIHDNLLSENKVHVIRSMARVPCALGQRFKCIHILVNLIKNAVESMNNVKPEERFVEFKTWSDEEHVFCSISDSGEGIAKNDCEVIFQHGFTTKEKGKGFSLHSSANYMTEMSGKIWAESKGKDRGSTFFLQFQNKKK